MRQGLGALKQVAGGICSPNMFHHKNALTFHTLKMVFYWPDLGIEHFFQFPAHNLTFLKLTYGQYKPNINLYKLPANSLWRALGCLLFLP